MIITGTGRLGRDAELRYTPAGMAVCDLVIACNYGKKDHAGERPTQWYYLTMWGKQAESLQLLLIKGGLVNIAANDVHIETFPKNDGSVGTKLVGNIINIELLSSGNTKKEQNQEQPRKQEAQQNRAKCQKDDFDDDIPF